MQSRVRGSLFNILAPDLPGANVLDLFAGTGSLGLEALSHGASRCTFVEKDSSCAAAIRLNLQRLGFTQKAKVIIRDVFQAVHFLDEIEGAFDIIFLTPPYSFFGDRGLSRRLKRCIQKLAERKSVSAKTKWVLEHPAKVDWDGIDPLILVDRRVYGQTALSFYVRGEI
jgi:16S rRNA (guanine(966)-N(2))-methyltransferase RsmD